MPFNTLPSWRRDAAGAPQPPGCVLSPLLFSLYTNDCKRTQMTGDPNVKLLKFADDTTVIGLIRDGERLRTDGKVEQLAFWCSQNNLELNTLQNCGDDSGLQKFLGSTISQDLKWESNMDTIRKKAQQTMHFLHQLRKFNLPQELLIQFYTAIIQSVFNILTMNVLTVSVLVCAVMALTRAAEEEKEEEKVILQQVSSVVLTMKALTVSVLVCAVMALTRAAGAQGEPALVCEKYRAPVVDLPILVFFSKCQSSSTVLGSEHRAHYRTSGHQATFMKSVPDCLGRDIHTSGPLEKNCQSMGGNLASIHNIHGVPRDSEAGEEKQ
ncbi:hypothetical protein L3Q82_016498, partial [Scortum barcoo]